MDDRVRSVAEKQLSPGEKLLWWGKPHGSIGAVGQRIKGIILMLLFTLFALFWTGFAFLIGRSSPTDDPLFQWFPLFGLPFILFGLGGVIFQIAGIGGAMKTSYAVTDQRVIIIEGKRASSYGAADLAYLQRTGSEARGSLEFAHSAIASGAKPTARLFNIADPVRVEGLIRASLLTPAS